MPRFLCHCQEDLDFSLHLRVIVKSKNSIWILYVFFLSFLSLKVYPEFLTYLETLACAIHPLLDSPPVDIPGLTQGSLKKKISALRSLKPLVKSGNDASCLYNRQ